MDKPASRHFLNTCLLSGIRCPGLRLPGFPEKHCSTPIPIEKLLLRKFWSPLPSSQPLWSPPTWKSHFPICFLPCPGSWFMPQLLHLYNGAGNISLGSCDDKIDDLGKGLDPVPGRRQTPAGCFISPLLTVPSLLFRSSEAHSLLYFTILFIACPSPFLFLLSSTPCSHTWRYMQYLTFQPIFQAVNTLFFFNF